MQIPPEALEEFKQIFREQYGVELSNEEALESAHNLLNFVKLITRPIENKN